ncbi:putative transporter [Smittium mucronatum]|uniref:Putative transporter n=1 Tax=Smittium mucronatum TaxID=133383 RepID=A0A1R0H358_9FUNG|nr:putative transporter [Smittium mucronatum]
MNDQTAEKFEDDIDVLKKNVVINKHFELTETEKILVKQAVRKIDLRIVPIVVIIYISALMDRSNIGSALVNGLKNGLNLTKGEEANVTSIFYVFYIICETPSNILLKRFSPHTWFGFIGVAWSVTCISLAFCKNGTEFVIARAILGALESGLTPGIVGYLQYWYTKHEISYRMTLFFAAIPVSGVIGSPLAGALAGIKVGKFLAFQSIFLFEGLITLVICVTAFFIIQDYPDKAKFFTPEEHDIVIRRLRSDQGMASESKVEFKETLKHLIDWKMWMFAMIYFGLNNAFTVLSLFSPTIIKSLGYSSITATYLASLPSVGGLLSMIVVLLLLNRVNYSTLIYFLGVVTIIGYSLAAFTTPKIPRLVYLTIGGFGAIGCIPVLISWMSVNQGGIYKGIISSAVVVSFSSICGAVSPHFFVVELGPKYTAGNAFAISATALSIILTFILSAYFRRENDRREKNPIDISHVEELEQRKLNDKHPNFRYRL